MLWFQRNGKAGRSWDAAAGGTKAELGHGLRTRQVVPRWNVLAAVVRGLAGPGTAGVRPAAGGSSGMKASASAKGSGSRSAAAKAARPAAKPKQVTEARRSAAAKAAKKPAPKPAA